jgi:hypothetical protein
MGCEGWTSPELARRFEEERLEREAKRAGAAAAKFRSVETKLDPMLVTRAQAGDVSAMKTIVVQLAAAHGITIETRDKNQMPSDAAAYAHVERRVIVVPPVVDPETFAISFHEIGHCASEPCRGGDHQPDPRVERWRACVRCEQLALVLDFESFSLRPHHVCAPAAISPLVPRTDARTASANAAADRLRQTIAYAARVSMDWKVEQVAEWRRELARR